MTSWGAAVNAAGSNSNVTQHGSTATNVSCKDFDFNFKNAHITGNVVINIPNVGEVFCGEAGTTSGGSSYTNETSSTSNATHYNATKNANGTYNLAPAQATST